MKVFGNHFVRNFRLVSLTPTPMKVKIIHEKLNIVVALQISCYYFRTEWFTARILNLYEFNILTFRLHPDHQRRKVVYVIYVYLSKEFDKVCDQKLLAKLELFGIQGVLLNWLKSFLDNRGMTLKVRQGFFQSHPYVSGVPQGGSQSLLPILVDAVDLPNTPNIHCYQNLSLYR